MNGLVEGIDTELEWSSGGYFTLNMAGWVEGVASHPPLSFLGRSVAYIAFDYCFFFLVLFLSTLVCFFVCV